MGICGIKEDEAEGGEGPEEDAGPGEWGSEKAKNPASENACVTGERVDERSGHPLFQSFGIRWILLKRG